MTTPEQIPDSQEMPWLQVEAALIVGGLTATLIGRLVGSPILEGAGVTALIGVETCFVLQDRQTDQS